MHVAINNIDLLSTHDYCRTLSLY